MLCGTRKGRLIDFLLKRLVLDIVLFEIWGQKTMGLPYRH